MNNIQNENINFPPIRKTKNNIVKLIKIILSNKIILKKVYIKI